MAVTISNLTSGNDTDGGSSSTTASVTPGSNKLELLSVSSRTNITADPNQPTVTGNGLTWVAINSIVYDTTSASRKRITLFRAMGASPSTGAITIDFGGQAQTDVVWSLDEASGIDTGGTNGSAASVQSATAKDETGSATSLTVTLAAFADAGNATFGAICVDNNSAASVGSGFTQLAVPTTTNQRLISEWKATNDTGVDASFGTSGLIGGVAIEIKAAAGVTDVTVSPSVLSVASSIPTPTVSAQNNNAGGSPYSSNLSCGLITNSSFELDFTGWDAEPGWVRTAENAHTGAISAKLATASGGMQSLGTTNDATGITVAANTFYDVTVWVNTSITSGTGMYLYVYTGSQLGTKIAEVQILNTDGVWTQYSARFFSGTSTKVWLRLFNNNSILTAYVDDFCLAPILAAPTVPIKKHYYYKVYDGSTYKTTWSEEVISEPTFRSTINAGGSDFSVTLARPFDDFGEDDDVKLNNRVDVYVVDRDAPNGLLIYSGYISGYTPMVSDSTEQVQVTLFPYSQQLARMVLRDGSGNTTLEYLSTDPSNILKDVIDKYRTILGGSITYTNTSIAMTNTTVTYTFNTNTIKECIDKVIELCPVGWYWYVDPNNVLYLQPRNLFATHAFALGLEVKSLQTFRRIEDLVNRVLFTGAGSPALFRVYENTGSQTQYGLYEKKVVDQRVSVVATAATISNRIIDQFKDPEIRSRFTIIDNNGANSRGYDIESIKPGQTLKIRNLRSDVSSQSLWDSAEWDVDVWDQTLTTSAADVIQILSIDYRPDSIVLEASSRLPQIAKRIEDIQRNLENTQTVDNPTAPS